MLVQTYRDYFDEYRLHPEAKALDTDGRRCHPWTRGPLQPPQVRATRLLRVAKEANALADTPALSEVDGTAVEYRALMCQQCGKLLCGRQRQWCSDRCRMRAWRS